MLNKYSSMKYENKKNFVIQKSKRYCFTMTSNYIKKT